MADSDPIAGAHRTAWRGVLRVVLPLSLLTLALPNVLGLAIGVEPEGASIVIASVHSLLAVAAGATTVVSARALVGRARQAWTVVGSGLLIWGAANVAWTFGETADAYVGMGVDWLPPFTLANAVLLVGTMALPASRSRVARIRRLDTALMAISAMAMLWVLPIRTLVSNGDHGGAAQLDILTGIKVLMVLVAMSTFVRCRPDERNEIKPLAFGLILLALADLAFTTGGAGSRLAEALYTAALLLLFIAGRRLGSVLVCRPMPATASPRYRAALPELATVIALVALAVHAQFEAGSGMVPLVLGTALVLLAIVRLGQLDHEQRRLMTSLQDSARSLFEQARADTLTGLGNRLALDERLERAVTRRPVADQDAGLAVFFVDIDHFKRFNDGLGHHVGDQLLVEVATRLRSVLGDDVHRVGGDEFVGVCDRTDLARAQQLGDRIVELVRTPIFIDGHELNCTVSVGLAHLSPGDQPADDGSAAKPAVPATAAGRLSADDLLRRADLALYRAKARGRNGLAAYDPMLQQFADARLGLRQGLHVALERDEIEVHYQPVVQLATDRVVGLCATPRWRSDQHGLLEPATFMPTMIDGGMLPDLGAVLFRDISGTLFDIGAGYAQVDWVSTVLCREEIVLPGLVDRVTQVLGDAGVPGCRLRIVVSEDTVLDEAALRVIQQLRAVGVHLTVHRFGTGPSSMLGLGQYPANTICIDPSFIDGLGRRHDDTVIVTAVSGLTTDLGMELAADGIAEEFQAQMLVDIGCTLGQGRLFGSPAPRWDLAIAGARR